MGTSQFLKFPLLGALPILTLIFPACRQQANSNCATVAAIGVGGVPYNGAGGFVSFSIEERRMNGPLSPGNVAAEIEKSERLCTAVFDFTKPEKDGRKPIRLWTAAHCVGRSMENVVGLKLEVFSNGVYTTIPASFDFLERRIAAAKFLATRGVGESAWSSAFGWYLSLEDPSGGKPPCRVSAGERLPGVVPETQNLCASWSDLLTMDLFIASKSYAALRSQLFPGGNPSAFGADDEFVRQHDLLTALRRETSVAEAVDSYHRCRTISRTTKATSSATTECSFEQERALGEVLTKFALPDGRNALAEATKLGVTDSSKKYGPMVVERYRVELEKMRELWMRRAGEIVEKPTMMLAITNILPQKGMAIFQLPEVGGTRRNMTVGEYGLTIASNIKESKVAFSRGDSGSIFSIGAKFPMLALQSVNQEETSGGAAVARLPRRTAAASGRSNMGGEPSPAEPSADVNAQTGAPNPCISAK